MDRPSTQISSVAVVGAGYMGGGIAQVTAIAGLPVAIFDVDVESTRWHHERLLSEARTFEDQGLFPTGATDRIGANMRAADSLEDAVRGADLVEEAVLEVPEVKGPVLAAIEFAAEPHAIIGTNTSTLPIVGLAAYLTDRTRILGVHFSNPSPFIPGVELITHDECDERMLAPVEAYVTALGKQSARVADKAGFVLNRLQFAFFKLACELVEEGVATPEDIDTVVRTTFGFRLPFFGPFAIADMAGLHTYLNCFQSLEAHYGKAYKAPQALVDLVQAGKHGVSGGGGFRVDDRDHADLVAYRTRAYARQAQLVAEMGPAPLTS